METTDQVLTKRRDQTVPLLSKVTPTYRFQQSAPFFNKKYFS